MSILFAVVHRLSNPQGLIAWYKVGRVEGYTPCSEALDADVVVAIGG
jgi:hypothetical protein